MSHSAPNKTCQYCKTIGQAYTFLSGETICQACLKSFPPYPMEMRQEIHRLRSTLATANKGLLPEKVDKWCSMQDYCRYAETVEQSDSECNTCITHCNFEFKLEGVESIKETKPANKEKGENMELHLGRFPCGISASIRPPDISPESVCPGSLVPVVLRTNFVRGEHLNYDVREITWKCTICGRTVKGGN